MILSFIAIPKVLKTIDKWILDSTAREMVEDLRWAQHLALTESVSHNFDIFIKDRYYRIKSILSREPTIKTVTINPCISSINTSLESYGSYYRLTFSATGIPSRTGTITLTSKKGNEKTITIAVGTGRVEIKP